MRGLNTPIPPAVQRSNWCLCPIDFTYNGRKGNILENPTAVINWAKNMIYSVFCQGMEKDLIRWFNAMCVSFVLTYLMGFGVMSAGLLSNLSADHANQCGCGMPVDHIVPACRNYLHPAYIKSFTKTVYIFSFCSGSPVFSMYHCAPS